MNENTVLIYAVLVFALMVIGLILTAVEFKYGAPSKQEKAAKAKKHVSDKQGFGDSMNAEARQI